jgi:hypothetical protein
MIAFFEGDQFKTSSTPKIDISELCGLHSYNMY